MTQLPSWPEAGPADTPELCPSCGHPTVTCDGYECDRCPEGWCADTAGDLQAENAAAAADEEYVRQHGNDDLETGHTRDPKGDEAAHS